jgi:biotin transport system substrate-specific component
MPIAEGATVTERSFFAPTLMGAVWPQRAGAALVRTVVLLAAGVVLLMLSAKLKVPFYPVPMTMQTFMVLLIGAAYGWRLGAATLTLYLVTGALGLPVFADTPERGIGLSYMMGPTGGYLAGFVAAAALAGLLAERGWDRSAGRAAVLMFAGHLVIFAFGISWLARYVGFERAWALGVAPFYLATVLKTALAAAAVRAGWWLQARR